MICSSVCLLRFIVWSSLQGQTPVHPGSAQGGNVNGNQADAHAVSTGIPSGGWAKTSNSQAVELCTGGSLQVRLEPPGRPAGVTVIVKSATCRGRMMFVRVYARAFFKGACGRGIYDTRRRRWRRSSVGKFDRGRPAGDPLALRPVLACKPGALRNGAPF